VIEKSQFHHGTSEFPPGSYELRVNADGYLQRNVLFVWGGTGGFDLLDVNLDRNATQPAR
jgi:hypothetical protein